jgi:hypothetical protein
VTSIDTLDSIVYQRIFTFMCVILTRKLFLAVSGLVRLPRQFRP